MKIFIPLSILLLFSCVSNKSDRMDEKDFTFLALGDSYTIGEAVDESDRWPEQLVGRLRKNGIKMANPRIIATTGWTTDELAKGIAREEIKNTYGIVSLLIGVNNQYRGYSVDQYQEEFKELLHQAISFAGGNPHNVYVVSIPDYGVTPFAKEKGLDEEKIRKELHEYNAIAEKITRLSDATFTSITDGSRLAKNDSTLIANDGLHPSGKMYSDWVDALYQKVYDNLSSR